MERFRHPVARRVALSVVALYALMLQAFVVAAAPVALVPRAQSPARKTIWARRAAAKRSLTTTGFVASWLAPPAGPPIMRGPWDEWRNLTLTGGSNPDFYT
jgi:hypothetical protein